jgi:hypothetical protein
MQYKIGDFNSEKTNEVSWERHREREKKEAKNCH